MTTFPSAGVLLGIVTNGWTAVQEAKIGQLGLSALIDVVLISEREGVRKPHPEIFHRALARLGVEASEAWFVGDNPDDDVAGAVEAGLRAFWRECPEWTRPTADCETIRTIDELLTLLSQESPETTGSQSQ